MKKFPLYMLIIAVLILAGCAPKAAQAPQAPAATVSPTTASLPTLSPPEPEGAAPEETEPASTTDTGSTDFLPYVSYYNADADFSLAMPPDWSAGETTDDALGKKTLLGPDPSIDTSSTIIVADPAKVQPDAAMKALCGTCDPAPQLTETEVNGIKAQTFTAQSPDTPPVEWYLISQGGKLVILSIHDADTLETLDALLQSFAPGKDAGTGSKYNAAAWAAQQSFAADQGVDPYNVVVKDIQAKDWPDSCVGAPDPGEECEQEVTPGFLGTLATRQTSAEFHSNHDGSQVRILPAAALAARKKLSEEKKTDESKIQIASTELVEWPDACMELPAQDEACAEAITPGYRVMLLLDEKQYEFHTDLTGQQMREAPPE